MHQNRNNGKWPDLKAKHPHRYDDTPLESSVVVRSHLDGETHDIQKVKKDRAARQLDGVQNMFKDMADYADKKDGII